MYCSLIGSDIMQILNAADDFVYHSKGKKYWYKFKKQTNNIT